MHIYNEMKNSNVTTEKKEEQKQFKLKLSKITTENPKTKSKDQLYTIKNLFNSREKVAKLCNDYAKIISEVKYKAKQGTRPEIFTSKQTLQGLPIALAQVKAGNKSENLLNEIWQIVYSFYRSKKLLKKVYNKIFKSIQL